MKFINYLSGIENASSYPMFSLLVFVLFFVVLLVMVLKMRKGTIDILKHIPLEEDGTVHRNENLNHENLKR
jgi:hypothetical protein